MKTRLPIGRPGALLGVAVLAWACLGQAQQPGAGQRAGQKVDEAVKSLKRGAREAGASLAEAWRKTKSSVHEMGVASRVYGRLHWDKALNKSEISLDVNPDGVVTLRGTVADAAARAKAVLLARETVGVSRVEDRLTVASSTPAAGANPAGP